MRVSVVAEGLIGHLFDDRYEVVSLLGSGRVADVYLADDRAIGQRIALKVLASRCADDEQFLELFGCEAGRAAILDHPNIVHISRHGRAEGTYYIAMEYLEGRSLETIILQHAPFGADLVTAVSLQILEALRFAHRQNVVHGDVEPRNIIVSSDGRVKVTDFGIARAAEGRPADMASDLHLLGMSMYRMATGRLPFPGYDASGVTGEHIPEQPPRPQTLNPLFPPKLETIIMHSLGVDPAGPYLTAGAMLKDMRELGQDEAEALPEGFSEEAARVMAAAETVPAAGRARMALTTRASRGTHQRAPLIEPGGQLGHPRRVWPWILVTILILALAAAAYVIASNRGAAATVDLGTVPKVVGMSESKAISKIQAAGFAYQIDGREPSVEVVEGDVLRQDTAAGAKLERGRTIGIWISAGTGQIEVPNVVGLTQTDAAESLGRAGLEVMTKPEVSPDAKVGSVLRQNPEAGKEVDPGTIVTITVASATNTVKVPPLIGMPQENATALLAGMDLVADLLETDSPLPGGIVDHQDPASGSEVEQGATVKVFVSNSPMKKTVIVPPVGALGLTAAEAKATLTRYGLKVKVVDLETPDAKPGLCVYQDPAAGAEVKIGSVVTITIAREPQNPTPPAPTGAVRYDHKDTHIVKTGSWADFPSVGSYGGSYGRSATAGATATIYFTGTRLDWIAMKGTTTGRADVYLDGVKKAGINLAATAPAYCLNVWSTGTLVSGRHQVKIVLSSASPAGKYLTLDAVDIWGAIRTKP